MSNLIYIAIGFFLAIGLVFVFMPLFQPKIKINENEQNEGQETNSKFSMVTWTVFLLVPIAAAILYAKLGAPNAINLSPPTEAIKVETAKVEMNNAVSHEMGDLSLMADKLALKLEKNPQNGEGWALLARSYVELKRHAEAVPAFEKAIAITHDDPQLLADYVDARAMTQNHHLDDKSETMINQALKLDPNLPKALMLAGSLAFDKTEYQKSIDYWEHLHSVIKGTDAPELENQVMANISEARHLLSLKK
jgi:cytochrome c-type biogenesis protein CcmH